VTRFSDRFALVGSRLDTLAGESITATKIGQAGVTTTAVVSDLADDEQVIGRRFSGILVSAVVLAPGDEITDADDTWTVSFTSKPVGGRYSADCYTNQLNG